MNDARYQRQGSPGVHEPLAYSQQVLDRLARIEAQLEEGERRFEVLDEHVKECTAEKQLLMVQIAELKGQLVVVRNLAVGLIALTGSAIVAGAIFLT